MLKSPFIKSVLALSSVISLSSISARAGIWTPPPSLTNPSRHVALYNIGRSYCDTNYNPARALVGVNSNYEIRASAYYAYGLMLTNDPTDLDRAEDILETIVQAQLTVSGKYSFTVGANHIADAVGTFKWNFDDDTGSNTNNSATGGYDENAGIFVGAALADIVNLDNINRAANSTNILDQDVRTKVVTALTNAVKYAVKLDMSPDYTNIALLSASVGAAGQDLGLSTTAGAWATSKLQAIYDQCNDGDSLSVPYEYLAPTYYGIDLKAVYNCQKFSFNSAFTTLAANIATQLWTGIGIAYHPPTYQMLGPWCRTYGENMLQYNALMDYWLDLGLTNGFPLPTQQSIQSNDEPTTLVMCDLPVPVRAEVNVSQPYGIKTLTAADYFYNGQTDIPRTLSLSRCKNNFMLGTVVVQDYNIAKRNLVAFWQLGSGLPTSNGTVGFCEDESNLTFNDGNSDSSTNYRSVLSTASGEDVLVAASTWKNRTLSNVGSFTASSRLTFAPGAIVTSAVGAKTTIIQHSNWFTYITPVTNTTAVYGATTDSKTNNLDVDRPWSKADYVGVTGNQAQVIAYVVSFRPSDQTQPTVTNPVLRSDGSGNITVGATVTDPTTKAVTNLVLPTFTH